MVNVEDDDVLVASVRSDGEAAQLVSEQHAGDLDDVHEDKVRTSVEGFLGKQFHSVNWFAIVWEWQWDPCWGACFC
jgi:hypothetical protein